MATRSSQSPEHYTMSFGEHLEELRRRLIYALLGAAVIMGAALYYGRTIVAFLLEPLIVVQRLAGIPAHTYTRSSVAGFGVYLKVAIAAALVAAAPWILYQLWRFVSPGLYAAERRLALFLVALSSGLTFVALVWTYYVFLPAALTFLIMWTTTYPPSPEGTSPTLRWISQKFIDMNEATFTGMSGVEAPGAATAPGGAGGKVVIPSFAEDPPGPVEGQIWYNLSRQEVRSFRDGRVQVFTVSSPTMMVPMIDPSDYLNEVMWIALATVVIFHIPVLLAILGMARLVHPETLAKRRRYIVFGCFVVAVLLTPSQDLFTNVLLPLLGWGLFEFGLVLMRVFYRRGGS